MKAADPAQAHAAVATGSAPADAPGCERSARFKLAKTLGKNSVVQLSEQAINVVLGMAVAVYLARELGPSAFGMFMLCLAIIRMATTVLGFGLDVIIFRNAAGDAPATGFITNVIAVYAINAVVILGLGAAAFAVFPARGDTTVVLMLLAMLPGLVFVPFEALEFWFRAKNDALSPFIARSIAVVVGSVLKMAVVAMGASLVFLGWAHALQVGLVGLILLVLFRRRHTFDLRQVTADKIGGLYREAWPLFITTLCTMVLMRLDFLMLSWIKGSHEAGLYAAATRISEVANLAPVIIIRAAAPLIFKNTNANAKAFNRRFSQFLSAFGILFLLGAAATAAMAPFLMRTLFGSKFDDAALLLSIHIFGLVFIWQGVATQMWWVKRRRPRIIMTGALAAAAVNTALNAILIPVYGAVGAAIASVIAQAVATVAINPFLGRNGWLLLRIQGRLSLPLGEVIGIARSRS